LWKSETLLVILSMIDHFRNYIFFFVVVGIWTLNLVYIMHCSYHRNYIIVPYNSHFLNLMKFICWLKKSLFSYDKSEWYTLWHRLWDHIWRYQLNRLLTHVSSYMRHVWFHVSYPTSTIWKLFYFFYYYTPMYLLSPLYYTHMFQKKKKWVISLNFDFVVSDLLLFDNEPNSLTDFS
jgi:hypothetical protein